MSVQMMGAVINHGPQDRTQFCVMVTLANYADDFGFSYPSLERIAQLSRCDLRTARRQIVELEQRGWLHVARKVLNGKSNVYQLNLEKLGVRAPSDARRHSLFTRLLKLYPDSMTPIFAPEKSEDTTHFSEDNPQPVQGTNAETQGTNDPGSEDIACPPNRYNRHSQNHHGTVNEVEPAPPTPSGEGVNNPVLEPGIETTTTADTVRTETYAGPVWSRTWDTMRIQGLGSDLMRSVPTAVERNFAEIVAGMNDFDACFRAWWLVEIRRQGNVWTFVTDAANPAQTQAGITKYTARLKRILSLYYPIARDGEIRIEVLPNRARAPAEEHAA